MTDKFGVLTTHLVCQCFDKAIDKGFFKVEEGIPIAYSTAQNATDYITRFGVAGQLSIGDAETDGTQVVGDNAHGNVGLRVLTVGAS